MVLKTGQTTKGTLYFKYKSKAVPAMNYTMKPFTVSNDYVQPILLVPNSTGETGRDYAKFAIENAPVSYFSFMQIDSVCDCLSGESGS